MATKRVRVSESPSLTLDTVLPDAGSINEIPLAYVQDFQQAAAANLVVGKTINYKPFIATPYSCKKCVNRNPVVVFKPDPLPILTSPHELASSKTLVIIHAETDTAVLGKPHGRHLPFIDGTADWVDWKHIHRLVTRFGWRLLVSTSFAALPFADAKLGTIFASQDWDFSAFKASRVISLSSGVDIHTLAVCPRVFTTSRATAAQTIQSRLPTAFTPYDAVDSVPAPKLCDVALARFPDQIQAKWNRGIVTAPSVLQAVSEARHQDAQFPTFIPPPTGDVDANDVDAVKAFRVEMLVNSVVRRLANSTDVTGAPVDADDLKAVTLRENTSIAVSAALEDYANAANINDIVMSRGEGVRAFTSPAAFCEDCGCVCREMNDHLSEALGVAGEGRKRLKFWACASCTPTILVSGTRVEVGPCTTRSFVRPGVLACPIISVDPTNPALGEIAINASGEPTSALDRVWPCLYTGKITVTGHGAPTRRRRDALVGLECTDDAHVFVDPDLLGMRAKMPGADTEDVATPCTACILSRVMDGTAGLCLGCQVPVTALEVGGVSTHFRHACLCDGVGRVVVCDTCAIPNAQTGLVCSHAGCTTVVHAECGGVVYKREPGSDEGENFALCGTHVGFYVREVPVGADGEINVVGFKACCAPSLSACSVDDVDDADYLNRARVVAFHDFDTVGCHGACCTTSNGESEPVHCVGGDLFCRNLSVRVRAFDFRPWSAISTHVDESLLDVVGTSLCDLLKTRYIAACGHTIAAPTDDPRQFTSCLFSRVADADPCDINPDSIPYMDGRHLDLSIPLESSHGRIHTVHIVLLKTDHAPVFRPNHNVADGVFGVASNVEDVLESLMKTDVSIVGEPLVFEDADIPVYVRDRVAARLMLTLRGTPDAVNATIKRINGIGMTVSQRRIRTPTTVGTDPVAYISSTLPQFHVFASGVAPDTFLERINNFGEDDPYVGNTGPEPRPRHQPPASEPPMTGAGAGPKPKGHIRSLVADLDAAAAVTPPPVGSKRTFSEH